MLVPRLIERKRDGGALADDEWTDLIVACANGDVPDNQMSALLVACVLRGMTVDETFAVTTAMLRTGAQLDFTSLTGPRVGNHSTGGVGDKVSVVLAPLVASLGVAVPMLAGRALGHTGGTLDKLESIPGFDTRLDVARAKRQLEQIGCAIIGQTPEISPASRRMIALRHATGTVESIPLIAASIMSKNLAENLSALVLDVKFGSGTLVPDPGAGRELADLMMAIGKQHGCRTVVVQTSMVAPLGRAIGNALEIEEAVLALRGDPEAPEDLMEVTFRLGAEMLLLAGCVRTHAEARERLEDAITSGRAAHRFEEIIEMQGGNPAIVEDPALLPQSNECEIYRAPQKGHVVQVEPRALGHALIEMGGGRSVVDARIDHSVGFMVTVKPGSWVDEGEAIATVFARDEAGTQAGMRALASSVRIQREKGGESMPLILTPPSHVTP